MMLMQSGRCCSAHNLSLTLPYLLQAPRPAVKGLVSAEGRAAALAAALREREACLAAAQAQLLQTEARHAQACALCLRHSPVRTAKLWSKASQWSLLRS